MLIQERMFRLHATNSFVFELNHICQHIFEKCPKQLDLFLCHPLYEDTFTAIEVFGLVCLSTISVIRTILDREFVVENLLPYIISNF